MKHKAIIFDLFGTLVENFPSSTGTEVLAQMAAGLGVPPQDFSSLWIGTYMDRMVGSMQNYQDCIKHICRTLGVKPDKHQVERAARLRLDMTRREVTTYREGAVEVLSHLKADHYKTGLISNCSMETARIWTETRLAPFVDVAVFSAMCGLKKPDARIFQIALDNLKVKAPDCVYVADGMFQEMSAAAGLGMRAILVEAPHNSDYEHAREEWHGEKISSLRELPELL